MRFFLTCITSVILAFSSYSQELNCQISIIIDNALEITTVEREALEELENVIYEIMNNTAWTKETFTVEERINCNLQLQIKEIPVKGSFSGSLQVQSSRPVLNSTYNTTLFNFLDKDINFQYSRNSIVQYAPNQHRDDLTSTLAFYAYFIIGMDYDSFSLKGGTKYFNRAQEIVSLAQSSGGSGWRANERGKRNRYWLVDNVLHELFSPLRDCNYYYHRSGLDKMNENSELARKEILAALKRLLKVSATRPNSVNLLNFVQAKSDEIKNMFGNGTPKEKNEVVNLLKRVDPSNSAKYQEILG